MDDIFPVLTQCWKRGYELTDQVLILGARGSVPVSGEDFIKFGGATTCVLVRLADTYVILDAGTGMLSLPEDALSRPSLTLLFSHTHVDHLLGLPVCPYVLRPGAELTVCAAPRGGLSAHEQALKLLAPPLWPVGDRELPAAFRFLDMADSFSVGPIRVDTMEGVHPGGVTLFRLSAGGKSVVFITDCTLTPALFPRAADFARDCDLLLVDGQYSDEEWPTREFFGHSRWTDAARLGEAAGAKRTAVIHHDPWHTDRQLEAAEAALKRVYPRCAFAREKEEINL